MQKEANSLATQGCKCNWCEKERKNPLDTKKYVPFVFCERVIQKLAIPMEAYRIIYRKVT